MIKDDSNVIGQSKTVYDMLSPKFSKETLDIGEIAKQANDPFFVSLLLFKLAEEREQSNKLLAEISEKFDRVMFELKQEKHETQTEVEKASIEILPEQDQKILDLVDQKGMCSASEIVEALGYKRQNAASQRLNKLFREGHLKKVRSGRKVLYLARK